MLRFSSLAALAVAKDTFHDQNFDFSDNLDEIALMQADFNANVQMMNSPSSASARSPRSSGTDNSNIVFTAGSKENRYNSLNQIIKKLMEDAEVEQGPGAAMRSLQKTDMGLLDLYGCWCYFQDDVGQGIGTPVDQIDEFCKVLHQGYECIMMDMDEQNQPCIPWEIEYNSAFGSGAMPFGLDMTNLINECENQNTNNTCGEMTCKVEGWFVQSYFTYSVWGGGIDVNNRHENGFDPVNTCGAKDLDATTAPNVDPFEGENSDDDDGPTYNATTPANPAPTNSVSQECCGSYPVRYPYKHSVSNQCCQQNTYNPNLLSCCSDGSVLIVCP